MSFSFNFITSFDTTNFIDFSHHHYDDKIGAGMCLIRKTVICVFVVCTINNKSFFIFLIKPVFISRDRKIVHASFEYLFSCFEIFIVFWVGKNPKFIPFQNLGPCIVTVSVLVTKHMKHCLMENQPRARLLNI